MRSLIVALVLCSSLAWANAPAPWAMCAGKQAGDSCSSMYYPLGRCVVDDLECHEAGCLNCQTPSGGRLGVDVAAGLAALIGAILIVAVIRKRRRSVVR